MSGLSIYVGPLGPSAMNARPSATAQKCDDKACNCNDNTSDGQSKSDATSNRNPKRSGESSESCESEVFDNKVRRRDAVFQEDSTFRLLAEAELRVVKEQLDDMRKQLAKSVVSSNYYMTITNLEVKNRELQARISGLENEVNELTKKLASRFVIPGRRFDKHLLTHVLDAVSTQALMQSFHVKNRVIQCNCFSCHLLCLDGVGEEPLNAPCQLREYFLKCAKERGVVVHNCLLAHNLGKKINAQVETSVLPGGSVGLKVATNFDVHAHILENYRLPCPGETYEMYERNDNPWWIQGFGTVITKCQSVDDSEILDWCNLFYHFRGEDTVLHSLFRIVWPEWVPSVDYVE